MCFYGVWFVCMYKDGFKEDNMAYWYNNDCKTGNSIANALELLDMKSCIEPQE